MNKLDLITRWIWLAREEEKSKIAKASRLCAWEDNGSVKNIGQSVGKYVLAR